MFLDNNLNSICNEFETVKERALKVPEESSEMVEMIAYIEKARIGGIQALNARIHESKKKMNYLLDIYFFSQDHIDLNCTVLMWPKNIKPVFDENDEVRRIKKCKIMASRFEPSRFFLKGKMRQNINIHSYMNTRVSRSLIVRCEKNRKKVFICASIKLMNSTTFLM